MSSLIAVAKTSCLLLTLLVIPRPVLQAQVRVAQMDVASPTSRPSISDHGPAVVGAASSPFEITVVWRAEPDAKSANYYRVFRGTVENFAPDYSSEVGPPALHDAVFEDGQLTPATKYYYAVYFQEGGAGHANRFIGKTCVATPPLP